MGQLGACLRMRTAATTRRASPAPRGLGQGQATPASGSQALQFGGSKHILASRQTDKSRICREEDTLWMSLH